jgi:hypothetical protein
LKKIDKNSLKKVEKLSRDLVFKRGSLISFGLMTSEGECLQVFDAAVNGVKDGIITVTMWVPQFEKYGLMNLKPTGVMAGVQVVSLGGVSGLKPAIILESPDEKLNGANVKAAVFEVYEPKEA